MRAVVAITLATTACGSSDGDDPGERSAEVYSAILAAVARDHIEPSDDDKPVIYALPDGPEPIAADVQAEVANAMKDDADVRFADTRTDVVDEDEAGEPVRDEAVLVQLGPVPERGRRVEVAVLVYRNQVDQESLVVTLMQTGDQWTVRSTEPA
jgi:hypothetical protein